MDDKIIDFKPRTQEELDLAAKRLEALKKLLSFRGKVVSKNQIRKLPDVKTGEIFWVEMDNRAYVVSERKGQKIVLEALDEYASLSTGMTIYELNKTAVKKEKPLDWEDEELIKSLKERFLEWFQPKDEKYFILYGRETHYFTLFVRTIFEHDEWDDFAEVIKNIGEVISIDFDTIETGEKCVEIWIKVFINGEEDVSVFYLFPADDLVVTI